jgi:hypothetical protein
MNYSRLGGVEFGTGKIAIHRPQIDRGFSKNLSPVKINPMRKAANPELSLGGARKDKRLIGKQKKLEDSQDKKQRKHS